MKNYCYKLLFACFLTATSFSQQVNNTEFKTKTLQVYQNLDKTRVPHGILLDFGMEFTNLKAFNGTLTDSTFTTSQTMSDIYKTLLMSRVRSNVTTGFITPQEYATRWYTQRTNGVMILSGNYFKYNNFADNAYPSKLNYNNNQFSDKFVGSTWQNPYEERQLFAMSPAISTYKGLKLKVKLPSNLFLSNYPATIQTIQIDFSNGLGYRTITYNQLLSVNYTQPNTYIWKYKITLTNGQVLYSHSKVVIENGLNATEIQSPTGTGATLLSSQSTLSTQAIALPPDPALAGYSKRTIVSTTQYLGFNASATIYIRYAPGVNTIRKPLIVAEGFDDGIILKPEQEAGSNNINDFLTRVNNSSSSLPAEMNTYDIIYVDWNNGVTFLQRNAFVLQEVIKWVNNNKTTTTQNVILGQSMGGLIARYALKDMENRGLPHDTRLYVSHDAPHLGANTPVSAQISARHLRNIYVNTPIPSALGEIVIPLFYNFAEGFSDIINLFGGNTSVPPFITPLQAFSLADTPATRQMTYNWVNYGYGINTTIHDAWQTDLANKGYPAIRNIAIANGSECGITQTNNGNILSFESEKDSPWYYFGIVDALIGVGVTNPAIVVTALLPGKSYWKSDFSAKYITSLNQNKNIYHGYLGYKKKVLWFIPVSIAISDLDIDQPFGVLPFDIYGGGQDRAPVSQIPINGIVSNTFGFIPTASSLDVGKWTTPINDGDYRRSFAGGQPPIAPKNSPFQNFVTGFVANNPTASNSRHISFNTRNGNWLATELDVATADEVTDCSYICFDSGQILGENVLCDISNYTYNYPGALNYNWEVTENPSFVTLTGNGSSTVTLSTSPTTTGYITLSLTISNANCGVRTLTKRIWIGLPYFNFVRDSGEFCDIKWHHVIFNLNLPLGTTSFDLVGVQPAPLAIQFGAPYYGGEYAVTLKYGKGFTGNITFIGQATNACGSYYLESEDDNFVKLCSELSTGNGNRTINPLNETFYKTYPNPSNNLVNIELKNQDEKPQSNAVIVAELYNMMGEIKRNVSITNNIATFDVIGLPQGIYILKINIDGNIESHQVGIQ